MRVNQIDFYISAPLAVSMFYCCLRSDFRPANPNIRAPKPDSGVMWLRAWGCMFTFKSVWIVSALCVRAATLAAVMRFNLCWFLEHALFKHSQLGLSNWDQTDGLTMDCSSSFLLNCHVVPVWLPPTWLDIKRDVVWHCRVMARSLRASAGGW